MTLILINIVTDFDGKEGKTNNKFTLEKWHF